MDIQSVQFPVLSTAAVDALKKNSNARQFEKELQGVGSFQKASQAEPEKMLNDDEQQYFEQLFPNAVQEIRAYNTYRKDGIRVAYNAGTVIDRKG